MGTHSIAEAKDQLSSLIERALKGESVVITKHGRPVAELRPIPEPPRPVTQADLDWLAEQRSKLPPSSTDAGTLVSRMRDEEWR
jgi:prevent-host-death family protein